MAALKRVTIPHDLIERVIEFERYVAKSKKKMIKVKLHKTHRRPSSIGDKVVGFSVFLMPQQKRLTPHALDLTYLLKLKSTQQYSRFDFVLYYNDFDV